eukprot:9074562-Karenia_brevis.AAC.1
MVLEAVLEGSGRHLGPKSQQNTKMLVCPPLVPTLLFPISSWEQWLRGYEAGTCAYPRCSYLRHGAYSPPGDI